MSTKGVLNRNGNKDEDTICAVSTPSGVGGVAVVRLSGPRAFELGRMIGPFLPEKPESHRIYFGTLRSLDGSVPIDEVLLSTFHHGKSYTGEETVEISCHGSPAITQWILQELVGIGARVADRGEFSYRAFINGKIDLVQAEGVLELVESQSKKSAQQGLRQLKGGLSQQLKGMENDLLYILANIEAAIDFSTENIEVLNKAEVFARTERLKIRIEALLQSYNHGRLLVDGLQVALVGAPNVGKSSLFNLLLNEDRSIVTEIPGTTRDVVESSILVDGVKISLLDTAGIRATVDVVEKLGIQRSRDSQASADVVFFLFDSGRGLSQDDMGILREINAKQLVLIGNKIDQTLTAPEILRKRAKEALWMGKFFTETSELELFMQQRVFFISTLEHTFRDLILSALKIFTFQSVPDDHAVISQARHFDNLSRAKEFVERAEEGFTRGDEAEFIALDLKSALICIEEILGARFDDQIMDFVFNQFCIGK